jgi:hypothetical protein
MLVSDIAVTDREYPVIAAPTISDDGQCEPVGETYRELRLSFKAPGLSTYINVSEQLEMAYVEERFQTLRADWLRSVFLASDTIARREHPAFQEILELGRPAVKILLEDMKTHGVNWCAALYFITGEQPVSAEHLYVSELAMADWLKWGSNHGLC